MAGSVLPTNCNNVLIATLGCRLNQTESEAIAKAYKDAGCAVSLLSPSSSESVRPEVSLVVVNTCAVTAKAGQKARRFIRLLLDKCPNARIVVTGCYAALCRDDIAAIDPRIIVVSGKDKGSIIGEDNPFLYTSIFAAHSRASLKVQDGCDCDCTFCTIHIARGKSVSLPAVQAVRRAKEIEANGYHEVALTGVNLGQWRGGYYAGGEGGFDGGGAQRLPHLLKALINGTDKMCFRLSSLHPPVIDDDFCAVLLGDGGERIRPHFHLSVQSGSDKVLRAMRRPYTRADIKVAVCALRRHAQIARRLCDAVSPFIACDIITGFPGESDEDFNDTLSLCRECGFVHIHAFPFSPRPHTAAYTMRPVVPQAVAGERVKALEELSAKALSIYVSECMGKVFSAIVESSKAGDKKGTVRAVTENFLHVIVDGINGGSVAKMGDEIKVRITGEGVNGADAMAMVSRA